MENMMDDISIREFRLGDAEAIVRLHSESQEFFEEMDVTKEFIQAIAERADYRFFIAEKLGELVGFSGVLYHPSLLRAEIGPIAVSKKRRNQGIGRALYEECVGFVKAQGIRRLIAKVKAGNGNALEFFEHAGFAREGFFQEYTKGGEDVIQLVKFI